MDKIDSFVIYAKELGGHREFTFILLDSDIDEAYSDIIIDYIDSLTRSLNQKFTEYNFTWQEAHKVTPDKLTEEIMHQHRVQKRFN